MGRRSQHQATDAAKAASEAAKVLQQRGQEARQEVVEKVPEAPKDKEPPEDWVPPKRDSVHRQMMDEIVASRKTTEPEAKVEPVEPEPVVEAKVEATAEVVEPSVEAPKTVKVKVDGEELDAPQADVDDAGGVKSYQIQKAAENRLRKANDTLAEVRRVQAEIEQARVAAQKPKEPEVTDDQFIASKIDAVRFGTPEESAAALREIMNRSNKPLDQNAIVEQATNRFRHDQAVAQFDTEFQDIVTNPLLLKLVVSLRNERIPQQKGHVEWTQFYRAIGNEVRSVVGKPTSSPATPSTTSGTPSQQSDKEARKAANVVNIPTAAARAAPPKEEKPETRQDVINKMRASRGLPVD
jgi:hypothetical protein